MKIKKAFLVCFITILFGFLFYPSVHTQAAGSPYLIKINKLRNCVTVYKKDDSGQYKPYKAMICSTGFATPLGSFSVKDKIRWHELEGPVYGQYCSRITGHVLFHSVWYYSKNNPATLSNTQYNNLGKTVSHGCVRLCVRDAKWIYNNCPFGTKIIIYNSKKDGPMDRPNAIKLPGGTGYDPTDTTNPSNPYNKKKPVITGAKSKTITYASKYDVMDGIKAKNTTGMNSIKLLKVTIERKINGSSKYEKVKKITSLLPGKYKIKYKLVDEIGRKVVKTVTHTVLTEVFVKSFSLNSTNKTLYLGGTDAQKTYTLKVKNVLPKTASIKDASFVSDNPNVATVTTDGKITAKGAGTCTITATAKDGSGVKATCKITVKQYAKSVSVSAAAGQVSVGQTLALNVSVLPSSTSNMNVNYTSSNTSVATVDANGVVKGIGAGTVTITAVTTDGTNLSGTITLTVKNEYMNAGVKVVATQTVKVGTTAESVLASLPATVSVTDKAGNTAQAKVTWNMSSYNAATAGQYTVTGTVTLPDNWIGTPDEVKANITVQS